VLVALAASCSKKDPDFKPQDAGILADAPPDAPPGNVTVGGMVTGLNGAGLVLENSGADDLMVTSNGPFQFTGSIVMGTSYAVTASQQPTLPSQTCTVANSSGTANDNVTDVTVICTTNKYNISGNVYSLASGANVKLQLNGGTGGNETTVPGDGSTSNAFQFTTQLQSGDAYTVGVETETGALCTPSGNSGTVGAGDVTGISINCGSNTYVISGTVSGLNGTVTLSDGKDTVSTSNGTFAFPPLPNGMPYNVTVTTDPDYPPVAQSCSVTPAADVSGTIGANISDIAATCMPNMYSVGGSVYELATDQMVTLSLNGGSDYPVTGTTTPPVSFTFPTTVASATTFTASVTSSPSGQTCVMMNNTGKATVTNGNVSSIAVDCDSGIQCGASNVCNPLGANPVCCDPDGGATCTPSSGTSRCSGTKVSLTCASAADCAVEGKAPSVCCYYSITKSTTCQTTCDPGGVELCDVNGYTQCAAPQTCKKYSTLSTATITYNACQN